MPDIKLPKSEFSQGAVNINLNKYLPEEKKKNLARLSDEELAQLSPEELEEAKQVRANLLAIKQVTKEVDTMENQERWTAEVQKFAEEHGLTIEEAEHIFKQRAGLGGKPSEIGTLLAALKPEPSPIEKAVSEVIATRIESMAPLLFPGPPANTGGGSSQAALSEALKQAKAFGAQSLYLPDGTMVNLAGGNNQEGSILQNATGKIQKYVTDIIDSRLSGVFNPQPGPVVGDSNNPEVAKLVFQNKWKEQDRIAQDAIAQRRDGIMRDIAAMVGAMFSPEGFAKFQKLLKEGPAGEAGTGKKGEIETKREAKLLKMTCWQCMRVFPYEEGQDPVCPYCGQAQNVQCPKCEEVFIRKSRDKIICPNCHAQLQTKPEEQGKPSSGEGEGAPEESSASISVGQGILE
ncbi:hypothetical protein ES706_04799 [subsurface metagenome]